MSETSQKAISEIQKKAQPNSKIVFVSGNFNIIHPGHLRLLRFAKECGDFLVVGVYEKSTTLQLVPEALRLESVSSIGFIDYAFILKDTPSDFIEALKPAIVVKGKEYEERTNAEQSIVDGYGGKLLFGSGDVLFSSMDLLHKEFFESNISQIKRPKDYLSRHGFHHEDLTDVLNKFKDLKVVVIGDTIVDEYITCDPMGMSQEDPTIVVVPLHMDRFIGGAAIVASHVRGLGAEVKYISVVGKDPMAGFAREKMAEYLVKPLLFEDTSRPTTLKQRFRAGTKTLLRVNHLRQHDVTKALMKEMFTQFKKEVEGAHLVIFSDFNYGCLPQWLVDHMTNYCVEKGIFTVADSQSSSQVGDVSRFKGGLLLTPTEREARLALRDFNSGLVVLAEGLRKKSKTKNIVITLGSEGILIHAGRNGDATPGDDWFTDRIPALNGSPKDVSGAGDAFLVGSSLALASGHDIWKASYFGSITAAVQVGRIGNIPLTRSEIQKELE